MLPVDELFNTVLGAYAPNRAFIRISNRVDLFREDGHFRPEATYPSLAVFFHEYLHYVHNFSTIAGYFNFLNWLQMAFLFTHTVGEDGRSRGSNALSYEQRHQLINLVGLIRILNGDVHVTQALRDAKKDSFTIKEVRERPSATAPKPDAPPFTEVTPLIEIPQPGAKPHETSFYFGAHCLIEGAAFEADGLVASGPSGNVLPDSLDAPGFPYHVARKLFEHLAGRTVATVVFIRATILALLTQDPAGQFVQIARAFRSNADPELILAELAAGNVKQLRETIDQILNNDLAALFQGFLKRGKISIGARIFEENFRYYLTRRKTEPFFETDCLVACNS